MVTTTDAPVGMRHEDPPRDVTVVCGECGGNGCKKCNWSGTVTITE